MKSLIKIIAIIASLIFSPVVITNHVYAQDEDYQTFYDDLSPYGEWVYEPNYGYVWVAAEGPGFVPYSTRGHWVYTDVGWTWVSDYPWGWATFHYGRWDDDPELGWFWVPGEEWGPSWVVWYDAPGYYGWAPIGPGISIDVAFGGGYYIPPERRTYCDSRYITSYNVQNYYAPRTQNVTIVKNTTIINNTTIDNSRHTTIVAGPRREDVQKRTGNSIQTVSLRASSSKSSQGIAGNNLNIYRPAVSKSTAVNPKPVPPKVANRTDVKPVTQRTSGGSVLKEGAKPTYNNQKSQPTKTPEKTVTPSKQVTPAPQKQTSQPQRQTPPPQKVTPTPQKEVTPPQKQTPPPQKVTPTPQKEVIPPQKVTPTPQRQPSAPTTPRPHQRYYTPRTTQRTTTPVKPTTPPPPPSPPQKQGK
jgi:hypothetical protein